MPKELKLKYPLNGEKEYAINVRSFFIQVLIVDLGFIRVIKHPTFP
jgi:hypothetical protein